MPPSFPSLLVLAWDDADATACRHRGGTTAPVLPVVQALAGRQPVLALLPQLPAALRTEVELAEAAQAQAILLAQATQQAATQLPDEPTEQLTAPAAEDAPDPAACSAPSAGVWVLDLASGQHSRIVGLADISFKPLTSQASKQPQPAAAETGTTAAHLPNAAAAAAPLVFSEALAWVGEHRTAGPGDAPAAPYLGRTPEVAPAISTAAPARSNILEQGHLLENTGQELDWLLRADDAAPPLPAAAEEAEVHSIPQSVDAPPDPAAEPAGQALPEPESGEPAALPGSELSDYEPTTTDFGEPSVQEAADLGITDSDTPIFSEEEEEWAAAPSSTFAEAQAALRHANPAPEPTDTTAADDLQYRIIQYARFAMHLATGPEENFGSIYAASWPTWLAALEIRYRTRRPLVLHLSQLSIDTAAPANRGWELELERYALRRAQLILVTSDALRRRVLAHYPALPGNVRVVALDDDAGIEREMRGIAVT